MPQYLGGQNVVLEALRSGFPVYRIYMGSHLRPGNVKAVTQAAEIRGIRIEWVDRSAIDRLVPEHQGVVAEIGPFSFTNLEDILEITRKKGKQPLLLLLDGIQDPQNLGALLRTAEVAGADCVVIPHHRAAGLTAAVARASAGALFYIPIVEVNNLVRAVDYLKSNNVWVIGLESDASDRYYEADYCDASAIVVGSEGRGLGRLVREHCDRLVSLPVAGSINSLNASVAGGIVLYEAVRQRYVAAKPV
jgi:23S rRNA (guanosine2251-2'-O)-methyltransferase